MLTLRYSSKTAAAVSAQAPVLVDNLIATMRGDKTLTGRYDGYASCRESLATEFTGGLD